MKLIPYKVGMSVRLEHKGVSPTTGTVVAFEDDSDEYTANVEQWLTVHLDGDTRPEGVKKFRRPHFFEAWNYRGWEDSSGRHGWVIRLSEGGGA